MSFTDAVKTCFRKYATFSGRASRPEYWWFMLFLVLGSIVLGIVDAALFGTETVQVAPGMVQTQTRSVLGGLFALATFIPALAAGWRRMHDSGRSGIYLLYPLIAMFGVVMYMSFVTGLGAVTGGNPVRFLAEGAGLVMILAMLVATLSPLVVIWWLARPTQPETNQWGPPPQRGPA